MTRKEFILPGVALLSAPLLESMGIPAWADENKQGKKRALLIGVNGYEAQVPKGQDFPWSNLHTAADVWAMKRVLMDKFKFADADFTVLIKPEDTTKEKILKALDNLAQSVSVGDIVYIHYSGHGDDSRQHGQTLVPSDWYNPADPKDNKNSRHITSAELAAKITAIKNKLTPIEKQPPTTPKSDEKDEKPAISLTIALDCCHSGHLLADVRGGKGPQIRGRNNITCPHTNEPEGVSSSWGCHQTPQADGALPESVFTGVRGFCAFLACRYDEVAGEIILKTPAQGAKGDGEYQGYLTHAIVEAFQQASTGTTNEDILIRLQARLVSLNPDQHPVLIGDRSNVLLQGTAIKQPAHFVLRQSERDKSLFEVNAGLVHFITPETLFALYKPGTKELITNNQVGTAKVTEGEGTVRATKTEVTLIKGDTKLAANGLWAVPVRPYGEKPVLVSLDKLDKVGVRGGTGDVFESAIRGLGKDGLVEVGTRDSSALELVPVPGGFDLRRIEGAGEAARIPALNERGKVIDGPTIRATDTPENKKAQLLKAVDRYARANVLRGMATGRSRGELNDDGGVMRYFGVAAEMRLVPVAVKATKQNMPVGPGNASFANDLPGNSAEKLSWKVGEWFAIEVRNRGSEDCFVTVFDIDPNHWVTGIYPVPGYPSMPLRVAIKPEDDKWIKLKVAGSILVFRVSDPPGQETMHVIATPAREGEVDLTALVDSTAFAPTRGGERGSKGAQTPIARLLLKQLKEGRRGAPESGIALQAQDLDAWTVPYLVVK